MHEKTPETQQLTDEQLEGVSGGVAFYWKGEVTKGVECVSCKTIAKHTCCEGTVPINPEEVGGFKPVLCRTVWQCSNCGAKWSEVAFVPSQHIRRSR